MRALLEGGADAKAKDRSWITPLHDVARGNPDIVHALLQGGADASAKDRSGITPLHDVAGRGDPDIVRALLKGGADANVRDGSGETPLHHATRGDPDVVRALLEGGADANVKDGSTETLLHHAAGRGHVDMVHALLEEGADANVKTDENGTTPLHLALYGQSHFEIVALLWGRDAEVTSEDLCAILGSVRPLAQACVEKLEDSAGCGQREVRMKASLRKMETVEDRAMLADNGDPIKCAIDVTDRAAFRQAPRLLGNILLGKLTQCDVKYSWVPPALAKDPRVIRTIANARLIMVGTETVNGILHSAWQRVIWRSWAIIVLKAAYLMAAALASYSFRQAPKEQPAFAVRAVLFVSLIHRLVQEVADIRRSYLEVVRRWWIARLVATIFVYLNTNILDVLSIILHVVGTMKILGTSNEDHDDVTKGIVAAFCAQQWLSFTYALRVLAAGGMRLLPMLRAIADTAVFGLVVATCLMASTNAYYIIGARQESERDPSPLYAAILAIYRLGILGDFDIFHLEGSDPKDGPRV